MSGTDGREGDETPVIRFFRRNRTLYGAFRRAELLPAVTAEGRGRTLRLVDEQGRQLMLPDPTDAEMAVILTEAGVTLSP